MKNIICISLCSIYLTLPIIDVFAYDNELRKNIISSQTTLIADNRIYTIAGNIIYGAEPRSFEKIVRPPTSPATYLLVSLICGGLSYYAYTRNNNSPEEWTYIFGFFSLLSFYGFGNSLFNPELPTVDYVPRY